MAEIDHILWAAPDLDAGSRLFAALTSVEPARGGTHPGFGTRNSLAALGDDTYLEIIAPDPEQSLAGNRGGEIAALQHPGLLTFAIRTTDLAAMRAVAERAGLSADAPFSMRRTRPDGITLAWSVLHLRHAQLGPAIPFAIDWGTSPHPARTAPRGCRLKSFVALQPEPSPLAEIYRAIGVEVEIKRAARAGLVAVLDTPKGEAVLMHP